MSYELLNKINGQGLSAEYRFTRGPCIYSSHMVGIEIDFKNQSNSEIKNIGIGDKVSGDFFLGPSLSKLVGEMDVFTVLCGQ